MTIFLTICSSFIHSASSGITMIHTMTAKMCSRTSNFHTSRNRDMLICDVYGPWAVPRNFTHSSTKFEKIFTPARITWRPFSCCFLGKKFPKKSASRVVRSLVLLDGKPWSALKAIMNDSATGFCRLIYPTTIVAAFWNILGIVRSVFFFPCSRPSE